MGMMYNPLAMYGAALGDIGTQQDMIREMMWADWMTSYAVEWDKIYAGINPVACKSVSGMQAVGECLDTWATMLDHTDGKWMMYMEQVGDEMTMGLTDTYAWDWMPTELRMIANKPLISRNNTEIIRIDIPLYDGQDLMWNLLYADNTITLDAKIPNEQYDRETEQYTTQYVDVMMRWSMQWDQLKIAWSAKDNEFAALRDIQWSGNQNDMWLKMMLDISNTDGADPLDMTLVIDLDQSQQVIDPMQVQAPPADQTIDLEMLMLY